MKKVSILLMLLFFSVISFAQEEKSEGEVTNVPGPAITFEETLHEFGDISDNQTKILIMAYGFVFNNPHGSTKMDHYLYRKAQTE